MLKFYNSLIRKKENFVSLKNKQVGIYTCGPTVYDYAHIGNLRSYIFADILQRTLKFNGYSITWVMNITNVDDKTIRDSQKDYPGLEPKEALKKLTEKYAKIFWQDLSKLNIQKPNKIPHATEFIPQMQDLIVKIIEAGYAYEKNGSFYFNVGKYAKNFKYGKLIKLDLGQLKAGVRIQADEYEKEELQDFALWKAAKTGEPAWNFEWQNKNYPGHPGWHIECSAMSHEYLGIPFDIHTGGIDLKFPHHENEIAQSITGYSAKKLASIFMHNEHVLVEGQKMAKRFKNFYTLKDLEEKNINPLAYRYLALTAEYDSKLNFTWESIKAAQNTLKSLYDFYQSIFEQNSSQSEKTKKYQEQFKIFINDNLDTPKAIALMWAIIKNVNLSPAEKKFLILEFDEIFGLGVTQIKKEAIPEKIKKLTKEREKLRQEKKWQEADKIRKKIKKIGYLIEDTEKGPKIKKI